jgi:SNF2 family DNA or RNA helicase
VSFPSLTVPWNHQVAAFDFAKGRDGTLLAPDMGCGKSMIAIALLKEWERKRVLIVCQNAFVGVWPREFKRHSQDEFQILTLNTQSVENRADKLRAFLKRDIKKLAVVTLYESYWMGRMRGEIMDADFDAIIFDECQNLKTPGGKASRFAAKICKTIPKRLGLSGTPMPHSPRDIYAQGRALCPEVYGTSKTSFELQYCIKGGFQNYNVVGYKNQDEFKKKLDSFMFRVTKDEALDLPEEIHITLPFTMEGEIRDIYRQMEKEFYIQLDQGEVTAANALVKLLRLQQITSGFVKNDADKEVMIGDGKMRLLYDLLENVPGSIPVVVFCRFKKDIQIIKDMAEKWGRKYGEISGARKDLTPEATMPKDITLMAVQIQSGSSGIDLSRSNIGVFYSPTLSRGEYEQCLSRLHRPPQINKVTFYHLTARNSVDEKIYRAFERGKNVVDAILNREV